MVTTKIESIALSVTGKYRLMAETKWGDEICWDDATFNKAYEVCKEANLSPERLADGSYVQHRYYVEPDYYIPDA